MKPTKDTFESKPEFDPKSIDPKKNPYIPTNPDVVEDTLDHTKTYSAHALFDHEGEQGPAQVDLTPSHTVDAKPLHKGVRNPPTDLTPTKPAEPRTEHDGHPGPAEHDLSKDHKE